MCCQRSRGEDRRIRQSHGTRHQQYEQSKRRKEWRRSKRGEERAKKASFARVDLSLTNFLHYFFQGVRLDGGRLNVVVAIRLALKRW